MRIPSGVTDQYIYFVAVDATDLKTRETGLTTFTVYRSRNGAAAAAFTTPIVTEVDASNMTGVYKLLLDEDMTISAGNDSEEVCLHITQASMAAVTRTFELYRPKVTAGQTLDVSSIPTANTNADALLDRVAGVEPGKTLRETLRLFAAVLLGKVSGAGTGTETFRDTNDGTDRVVSNVDSKGNRSTVTLDAS